MNKQELIDFEKEIFELFNKGKIRGVVHLSGEGEDELIEIFKKIKKQDWVFSGHRNHYHMLLKAGPDFVRKNIMKGNSMHQYSKEHKVFTSGIVCGSVPIALGVALAIKLRGEKNHVWCFVGDMGSDMGSFSVCSTYALGHDLPITFIIEDNGISVYTPTEKVWGNVMKRKYKCDLEYYKYKRKYPHHGGGQFIHF